MDSFNNFKPKSKKTTNQKATNFIEALKDLGSAVKKQTKDATLGTGKTAINQVFNIDKSSSPSDTGELKPGNHFDFEEFLKSREKQIEYQQKQRYQQRFEGEKVVFHHKEEEAKVQIKSIQEELKKLAKETVGLSQEIKKAVFNNTVEPGTYHLTFFEKIKKIIELARKQIAESRTWFESFNQRKKQKESYYWFNVKKSGTKFMLSQERYMTTQTG